MAAHNVKLRLDAWRDAAHRRDTHAPGSSAWREADDEVATAEKAFHAELAQVSVRYAEQDFHDQAAGRLRGWIPARRETETDRLLPLAAGRTG